MCLVEFSYSRSRGAFRVVQYDKSGFIVQALESCDTTDLLDLMLVANIPWKNNQHNSVIRSVNGDIRAAGFTDRQLEKALGEVRSLYL